MLVAAYQQQLKGLVEPRYQNIVDRLENLMAPSGKQENMPLHLAEVFLSHQISVRKSTGMTLYQVLSGHECLLLVAIAMESWRVGDWLHVERAGNKSMELLALRARQLERRPEDIEKVEQAWRHS